MFRATLVVSFFVVLNLLGCAGPQRISSRMRVVPEAAVQADPSLATVVFVKPSKRVVMDAVLDATEGVALGEVAPLSKLVVRVAPGPRTFITALYKDSEHGKFTLWGHDMCAQITGELEVGKIYFVEMSAFRPFVVKANDPRLPLWAAGQTLSFAEPGAKLMSGDREWEACRASAAKDMTKERQKGDGRSVFRPEDGRTSWPQ